MAPAFKSMPVQTRRRKLDSTAKDKMQHGGDPTDIETKRGWSRRGMLVMYMVLKPCTPPDSMESANNSKHKGNG